MPDPSASPIVIVGAGAAGILAAVFAAGGRRPVLLLERTADGGRKILISGGGRCNILPMALEPDRFVTDSSPHTLRNLLTSWPLDRQRAFFEEDAGLPLVEEAETRKLFPRSQSARDVRDRLLALARGRGTEIRFGAAVRDLEPPAADKAPWTLHLEKGDPVPAHAVILATGGLSVPRTGSDGLGLGVAARLGHTIHETYPALTPLTLEPPRYGDLAGVSCTVTLRVASGNARFATRGGFLFTHRGYSGPTVLDASHLAVRSLTAADPARVTVQWTDQDTSEWEARLRGGPGILSTTLRRELPQRLADRLLVEAGLDPAQRVAQLTAPQRRSLVTLLAACPLPWSGSERYKKAEVTGGGVALSEVDPRTMESRLRPRLYLCGEMLDAFGPIGGHNFAWAWATGRLAGLGARGVSDCGGEGRERPGARPPGN